jgi:hypothetical protein
MSDQKPCDECGTGHPAKYIISNDKGYRLVCADCSKEINKLPDEQTVYRDIGKEGFYEAEYPET